MKTVLYFRLQWRLCQRYADGVFRYARKAGWRVQLIDTVRNTPPARQAIDWWRADGCIVDWLFMDYIGWTPDVFADLPTVFIDASRTEPYRLCSSVDHDAVDCVRLATDELLALGYENYAYVGTIADFNWEKLRRTAFERRMAAAGKRCLMFRPVQAKGFDVFYSELGPWLASLPRPCGIFAANDKVASRVLNACELARIKVPESIAVVGVVLGVPDDFGAVREPDILRCVFVQGHEDVDETPANPDDERGVVGKGCDVGTGRARS